MVSYIANASHVSRYINKEFRKQNAFSAVDNLPTAILSSASPAPLLSAPSDKLLAPATPDSPVPLKRTLDRSPSHRAGKRAKVKGRTNKRTWDEARDPDEERGKKPEITHTMKFGTASTATPPKSRTR